MRVEESSYLHKISSEENDMNRKLLLTAVFLILSGIVVACQPGTQTVEVTRVVTDVETVTEQLEVTRVVEVEAPAQPEGELIVALSTLPNSLYFPNAAERNASNVSQQIFEGLVWLDDDNNVLPALAESWEISEDGTEYIFHLREGVKFHNGADFTAEDVVTSWIAGKDPANAYAYVHERADSVEVIDDYTVKITTPEPDPLFLIIPARDWAMIPTDYYNEVGLAGIEENPIGTGPFKFVEWVKGERIVLEAFEDYWDEELPKVASLVFRPIPESSTRVAAVQTGEIHIANRLSSEEAQSLLGVPDVQVVRYPVDRVYYIAFNNLTSGIGQPTEDVLVRQAMNYAVDRQAIIDALFDGFADLSTGYITPGNLGYNDSIEPYPYDPDRARELLAEAGYPDGFEIGFACPIGAYTNFEQVCEAVAGYFADVGITLEGGDIQFMESGQYWDLEANKELPPLFGDSWSTADGEALNRLIGAVRAESSYTAWSEPTIDDYLAQIETEVDPVARAALYSELHQYMYDNPPFIYLYEPNTFEAINAAVQNYKPRAAENYYLKEVFLAEPGG
jgi:peptide/nickel transport system substrate-binding protein